MNSEKKKIISTSKEITIRMTKTNNLVKTKKGQKLNLNLFSDRSLCKQKTNTILLPLLMKFQQDLEVWIKLL